MTGPLGYTASPPRGAAVGSADATDATEHGKRQTNASDCWSTQTSGWPDQQNKRAVDFELNSSPFRTIAICNPLRMRISRAWFGKKRIVSQSGGAKTISL